MASDAAPSDLSSLIRTCEGLSISTSLDHSCFSLDDITANPSVKPPSATTGGLLLAALLYRRRFPVPAMERALLAAWAPIWPVTMTALEENLFLFRFDHRLDLNRVLRDGPWRFNQYLIVMKEVSENSPMDRASLSSIPLWVQIYGIPILKQTEQVARYAGGLLGNVTNIDLAQGRNRYPYLRVRVDMDIRRPLSKETTLVCNGTDKKIEFRYERLFLFCFWCGYLDHILEDCLDFMETGGDSSQCPLDETIRGIPPRQIFTTGNQGSLPREHYTAPTMGTGGSSLVAPRPRTALAAPPGFPPIPTAARPLLLGRADPTSPLVIAEQFTFCSPPLTTPEKGKKRTVRQKKVVTKPPTLTGGGKRPSSLMETGLIGTEEHAHSEQDSENQNQNMSSGKRSKGLPLEALDLNEENTGGPLDPSGMQK